MKAHQSKKDIVEHLPALRAFALSLTRNSSLADDMVQDAVEKAWRNFDKFTPGTNLRAWLFTILRNNYYSNRRRSKYEVADSEGFFVNQMAVKPAHDGHLQLDEFRKAFATLPDEQREALILVGASGFSYDEAAQMCGCALGTIKSRVSRGRDRLAEIMGMNDEDPFELTDAETMAVVTRKAAS